MAQCSKCLKVMRSDKLRRHMKSHTKKEANFNVIKTTNMNIENSNSSFEVENGKINNFENKKMGNVTIEDELIRDDKIYDENIALGEQIASIITNGQAKEESLSQKNKYCLNLYRKNKALIAVQGQELKKWQIELMKYFTEEVGPSYREIVWVIGTRGNEGKSWFQSYVESYFGYHRVARFDIRNRAQDIFHALSRRPLISTDIFLFNVPRSNDSVTECSYSVMEAIKDGCATSTKYNSTPLRFKTPNVVMVFSNELPRVKQLSLDRWRIFTISKDENLIFVESNTLKNSESKGKHSSSPSISY